MGLHQPVDQDRSPDRTGSEGYQVEVEPCEGWNLERCLPASYPPETRQPSQGYTRTRKTPWYPCTYTRSFDQACQRYSTKSSYCASLTYLSSGWEKTSHLKCRLSSASNGTKVCSRASTISRPPAVKASRQSL